MWPEATGLLPRDFGREPDRLCVLELERPLERGADEVPDAPGELADAVTALRLATAAPVAAGPVLFERLDWRPYGIRPVLPIAATAPPREPTRLDPFRASVAVQLRPLLAVADDDPGLGDALDRWELALFQDDPFRAEQLRHALEAALGDGDGTWAAGMRAAALLGETAQERADLVDDFRTGELLVGGAGAALESRNRAVRLSFLGELSGTSTYPVRETAILLHDSKDVDLDFFDLVDSEGRSPRARLRAAPACIRRRSPGSSTGWSAAAG